MGAEPALLMLRAMNFVQLEIAGFLPHLVVGKIARPAKALPVRRLQLLQWQMPLTEGSPATSIKHLPQQQTALRNMRAPVFYPEI